MSFEGLISRIRGEYIEMPGLWLTPRQGARLWALEPTECELLLTALVSRHFLTMRADGTYGRRTDAPEKRRLP